MYLFSENVMFSQYLVKSEVSFLFYLPSTILRIESQHEIRLSAGNADEPIPAANTQICNSSVSFSRHRHKHAPGPQRWCDEFLPRVKGIRIRP
jgi:hypothetical protein